MSETLLRATRIFDGERFRHDAALLIRNGRVVAIQDIAAAAPDATQTVTLPPDFLIVPGFVDLQVNGGGGVLLNDQPDAAGVRAIVRAHRGLGTTALLPTAITDAPEKLLAAARACAEVAAEPDSGVVGVHLEGPFLSPERRGAHPAEFVRPADDELLAAYAALPALFGGNGRVMVTLAPEIVPPAAIAALNEAGILVSGGHSAASVEVVREAAAAGLSGFTHLFNAMPPIGNRAPAIAFAALTDPRAVCGIIADGIHVNRHLLLHAITSRPVGTMVLVSDSMPPAGTDVDAFTLLGRRIVRRDGALRLPCGTLAGADLDMAGAVRNVAIWLTESGLAAEVAQAAALRMATLYPARYLGLTDHGRLGDGARADFVVLDADLGVQDVWFAGKPLATTTQPTVQSSRAAART